MRVRAQNHRSRPRVGERDPAAAREDPTSWQTRGWATEAEQGRQSHRVLSRAVPLFCSNSEMLGWAPGFQDPHIPVGRTGRELSPRLPADQMSSRPVRFPVLGPLPARFSGKTLCPEPQPRTGAPRKAAGAELQAHLEAT